MNQPDPDFLASLRDRIEQTCRTIAPTDLPAGRPFYVVLASEIPSLSRAGIICGLQSNLLDLVARPFIGGRWRGPGEAILINDHAAWREAEKTSLCHAGRLNLFAANCVAVGLHECCHTIEDGGPRMIEPTAAMVSTATQAVAAAVAAESVTPDDVKWDCETHSMTFIRLAIHVFWRTCQAGLWPAILLPTPHAVVNAEQYGLSDTRFFADALADEPARRAGEPLASIARSCPPLRFLERYLEDQARISALSRSRLVANLQASKPDAKGRSTMQLLEDVVSELAESAKKRQLQRQLDFWKLSRDIADGVKPLPARIDSVLSAAGKSVEDLRAGVLLIARRKQQAQQIAAALAAAAERPAIEAKYAKLKAVLETAMQKFQNEASPLEARTLEINGAENAAAGLPRQLVESCLSPDGPHPALYEKYQALNNRIVYELQRDVNLLKKSSAGRAAGVHEVERGTYLASGGAIPGSPEQGDAKNRILQGKRAIAIADDADRELPGAIKALADAQAELAAIEREMMTP